MRYITLFFMIFPFMASANVLRATYTACVGIDDEISHLKTMAGINTAVTAVGTATGVGATVTGFVKADKDKQVEVKLEKLREIEQKNPNIESTEEDYQNFKESLNSGLTSAKKEIERYQAEIEKLNKQSKNLGNWRTGLLARLFLIDSMHPKRTQDGTMKA